MKEEVNTSRQMTMTEVLQFGLGRAEIYQITSLLKSYSLNFRILI